MLVLAEPEGGPGHVHGKAEVPVEAGFLHCCRIQDPGFTINWRFPVFLCFLRLMLGA